jgi:S-adenosylmethionine-diacylglycerol 3-amino-3-carboxypropyl transferase
MENSMSHTYFNQLNYTLANEDTTLELSVLPYGIKHVMSVAGSGSRVVPLLAKFPQQITCVDISRKQLYLTELRFEALRALTHSEYLAFWGYPPSPAEPEARKELYQKIQLSPETQKFFTPLFESLEWDSVLYSGKWEKAIRQLSRINRKITGLKGIGLFAAMNNSEHNLYMKTRFPQANWAITVALLGNAGVFNSLLYKGHFPQKNISESSFQFYKQTFEKIFALGPVRQNFLMQLLFFGKILFQEGNPVECDPVVYEQSRKALHSCSVNYVCGNLIEEAENSKTPIDFLSLSDVSSYFSGELEKTFMQRIRSGMADGGLVIIRNYLRIPEGTDKSGFELVSNRYHSIIEKEKVQMYTIDIFEKISGRESHL